MPESIAWTWRRAVWLVVACTLGCDAPPRTSPGVDARTDAFRPVALRVHPLTRVREHGEGRTVEACIELIDADGLPVRDLGVFDLVLRSGVRDEAAMTRQSWTCDVTSRADNTARFDAMGHVYLISLDLEGTAMPAGSTLDVTFTARDGTRLAGSGEVAARPTTETDAGTMP